ncbi:hypothetical protein Tco_0616980, partial [Tanacetum coccineum]
MKPSRALTVCESSRQGEARGAKIAASRNAIGAKGEFQRVELQRMQVVLRVEFQRVELQRVQVVLRVEF